MEEYGCVMKPLLSHRSKTPLLRDYNDWLRKVSQACTLPVFMPWLNQRTRCALEPWVKASGRTVPVCWRCSVSSPICWAALMADSISL